MNRSRLSRHLPALLSAAVASLLAAVEGLATNTLTWLGGSAWAPWTAVGALLAVSVVIEARLSSSGERSAFVTPDEIPRDVGDFTGREEELLELGRLVRAGSNTLLISAIDGTPGVGKSTLLIHFARRVVNRYPDARLYANLRGADDNPEPAQPLVVLEQFLRSLGERRIPQQLDAAAARYRTLLAGKRALILLDNASSDAQVRPLLPGTAGCTVVITSRARLVGLEGVSALTLNVFSDAEAHQLLIRIVGAARVGDDPRSTAEVVGFCGRLPLALRIAGSRLASRPDWTMATLSGRLADERVRLAALTAGHLDVRASFMISYRELGDTERRMFRLAAVAPTADLPAGAAARAVDLPEEEAKAPLDRLVALHLLEGAAPDSVQFHDLLRLFARERSAEEDTADDRADALGRILEWYLQQATERAEPGAASSWWEREQENLTVLVEHSAGLAGPLRPYCWRLAFAMAPFLAAREDTAGWQLTARTAADAAADAGDAAAHALALANLGRLAESRGDFAAAGELFRDAVRRLRRTSEQRSLAQALHGLARVLRQTSELDDARTAATEASRIHRQLGLPTGPHDVACMVELGDIATAQGRFGPASRHYDEALLAQAGIPDLVDRAPLLGRAGAARRALGRFDLAGAAFEEAARLYTARGDEAAYATMLEQSGITRDAAGEPAEAIAAYGLSQAVYRSLDRPADECRLSCNQAAGLWRQGRTDEAVDLLTATARRARRIGARGVEATARLSLGEILFARGDFPAAAKRYAQADSCYRELDDRAGRARALRLLARARRRMNDPQGSVDALKEARRLARQAHDDAVTVTVLTDLALAHRDRGDDGQAMSLLHEAVRVARGLRAPDPALTGRALMHLGGVESRSAHIGEAVTHFREAVEQFRTSAEKPLEAATLMYLGRIHRVGRPRYTDSEQAYQDAARICSETGDAAGEGRALAGVGAARACLGDAQDAALWWERAAALTTGADTPVVEHERDLLLRGGWQRPGGLSW